MRPQREQPSSPTAAAAENPAHRTATRRAAEGRIFGGRPFGRVRIATPADLQFVLALQRKHTNAVGHLPTAAIEWYIAHERCTLAIENAEPAGYVLGRAALRWCIALRPITQAAICFDAQRRHHGLALVAAETTAAGEAGQIAIQAMCREGLDANEFWAAAGFDKIGSYAPGNARAREVICWRKQLTPYRPKWFEIMPPVAGWKGKRTK